MLKHGLIYINPRKNNRILGFEVRTEIFWPMPHKICNSSDHFIMHPCNFPLVWSHVSSPEFHKANLLPDSRESPSYVWKYPLGACGVYIFFPSGGFSLVPSSIPLFLIILFVFLFSS